MEIDEFRRPTWFSGFFFPSVITLLGLMGLMPFVSCPAPKCGLCVFRFPWFLKGIWVSVLFVNSTSASLFFSFVYSSFEILKFKYEEALLRKTKPVLIFQNCWKGLGFEFNMILCLYVGCWEVIRYMYCKMRSPFLWQFFCDIVILNLKRFHM